MKATLSIALLMRAGHCGFGCDFADGTMTSVKIPPRNPFDTMLSHFSSGWPAIPSRVLSGSLSSIRSLSSPGLKGLWCLQVLTTAGAHVLLTLGLVFMLLSLNAAKDEVRQQHSKERQAFLQQHSKERQAFLL